MLYTTQLAQWTRLPPHMEIIDISAKSAVKPWDVFAPTWVMVSAYKEQQLTEQEYTSQYYKLMRNRYKTNKDVFINIINKAFSSDVALACYCTEGSFCHRLILKDILLKIQPALFYAGEFKISSEITLF